VITKAHSCELMEPQDTLLALYVNAYYICIEISADLYQESTSLTLQVAIKKKSIGMIPKILPFCEFISHHSPLPPISFHFIRKLPSFRSNFPRRRHGQSADCCDVLISSLLKSKMYVDLAHAVPVLLSLGPCKGDMSSLLRRML
jgi:hypothetical protein